MENVLHLWMEWLWMGWVFALVAGAAILLLGPQLKFVWYFGALPGTKRAERRTKKVIDDLRDIRSHWVKYRQELVPPHLFQDRF